MTLFILGAVVLAGCGGGDTPPVPTAPPVVVEVVGPGELKSAQVVNTIEAAAITQASKAPASKAPPIVALYAVQSTRLTYLTRDGDGNEVLASGLVSVPVKTPGTPSPVISYQHGTIFHDAEAPSNDVVAAAPPVVMASLGYIVVAADYVGYGASRGQPHPYLMATPTADAVIDLLTAARTWRRQSGTPDNGQLFLVGYSEGGYATVAAQRALQAGTSAHQTELMAAIAGAGPYHVGATLDVLLDRVRDDNPILGALISPGLLRNLGSTVRDEVRRQLVKALIPDDADVRFDTRFLDRFLADDNEALDRDHNVHDWAPRAPTRLFHGVDDRTVPYAVSTRTLEAMRAKGSTAVTLTDCVANPAGHLECVPPYFGYLLTQVGALARDL